MDAKLTISAWRTRSEQERDAVDVADRVRRLPKGSTLTYRGMVVRKLDGQRRGGAKASVEGPDGAQLTMIDFREARTAEIADALQAARQDLVG